MNTPFLPIRPGRGSLCRQSNLVAKALLLSALSIGCFLPAAAIAQGPTPGEVRDTLQPIPMIMEQQPPPPEIRLPEAAPRPAPAPDARRVKIDRFEFSGNTIFSAEELQAVVADWQGRELTLDEIYLVSDLLGDFYQGRGYSLTTVTVPAQRMRDGILRLEVVEGKTGRLIFSGNRRYRDQFLARRLELVGPGTILRFQDLEREVLLLNDLPGLLARSVLEPGQEYGTTDIHLTMEETRFATRLTLDNQGRKMIGRWRAGADFTINNPGGYGDLLTLGYTHTENSLLRQGRIAYDIPLGVNGARLQASYSRAEYDVGGPLAVLGIEGVSENARLQASYPLLRSRRSNLSWATALATVQGRSDLADIPLSDATINFLETGLTYNRRHGDGANSNLSALLASNLRGNSRGERNDAMVLRLELKGSHERPLSQRYSLSGRAEAVYSPDPLPDSHKYGIGGPTSVRGFVSSSLRGDYGGLVGLELRRFQRLSGFDLIGRAFIDSARVGTHSLPGVASSSASLTSAGVGVGLFFGGSYMLDLQWAAPLDGKDSGDGGDSRLWLSLSAGF